MDAIQHFSNVSDKTTKQDFIKLYNDYCVQTNQAQQLKFQMKDVSHLELNTHLFKIYCSDKSLNVFQKHILINYIGKMVYMIRNHHESMSNEDLDYRRAFVEFVKYAQTLILAHTFVSPYYFQDMGKKQDEHEYWFRILFNAMLGEQHLGLASIYLDLLNQVFIIMKPDDKLQCIERLMYKHQKPKGPIYIYVSPYLELPNLADYCLKMYNLQHTSISWSLFVDNVLVLIQRCIFEHKRYATTDNEEVFDSKLLHVLFLFLNHDDNQELFFDIMQIINLFLANNMIDYNPRLYQELFTSHNLLAISNLPNIFDDLGEKKDVQLEVLTLLTTIFEISLTEDIMISKEIVQNICSNNLQLYHDTFDIITVFKFLSVAFKYYPDTAYDTIQIKIALEKIRDEDVPDTFIHVLLNHLMDVFLYTSGHIGTINLGLEKELFSLLVNFYQFLTITSKSRMLMSLVVYEFMKAGHLHPELGYSTILKHSGYLDILEEDDNIYNRDILLKIKYNYMCTSLKDKCKELILDNCQYYTEQDLDDVFEIIY